MATDWERLLHLERSLEQLRQHVAEQDGEIFRLTKQIDKLVKRCEKLEGRLEAAAAESPLLEDRTPADDLPPHY